MLSLACTQRFRAKRQRDVESAADLGAKEVGTGYADDREGDALDGERPADHVGCAVEASLPESMADDGHRSIQPTAAPLVVSREGATQDRLHAQHIEI